MKVGLNSAIKFPRAMMNMYSGEGSQVIHPGNCCSNFFPAYGRSVMFKNVALHSKGFARPSGVDAVAWQRMCSSYKEASSNLCEAITVLSVASLSCDCHLSLYVLILCHAIY